MASLPIGTLALNAAIVHHLARGALLVLHGEALRCLAASAQNHIGRLARSFELGSLRLLPLVLGPLKRREMLPGVDLSIVRALNGLVGALLGAELVHEVISLFVRDSLVATIEELLD